MQVRYWIGSSFLFLSAALIAACLEEDTPPGSCASVGPDASCDGSLDPFGCSGPASLLGTWTASITEPNAKGTYTMTLTPSSTLDDKLGNLTFHRDLTYDETSPEHAGCRVLANHLGVYSAKDGVMTIVLNNLWVETREGCADPGDNVQGAVVTSPNQPGPVPISVYQAAVNGPYTLTACSLTINKAIFTNSKIPLDGDSGAGGAGGAPDGGPAECTDALETSCFGALACYTDIFKGCVPSGLCTAGDQVIVNDQLVAPFCFDNGVKFQSKTEVSDPFISYIDYYKSGGAFCWHADSTSTSGGDNTLVYKDMNGMVLATVKTYSNGVQKVTCAGQPEVTLDAACRACNQAVATGDCPKGVCTVP
jgi:hypothetical protein